VTLRAPDWTKCHRCSKPSKPSERVTHKGRVYCCPDCVEAEDDEVTQATLRRQVFERDRGVCHFCGEDVAALEARLESLRDSGLWSVQVLQLVRLGFPRGPVEKGATLWEAHHLHERVRGGANVLSNLVTACLACHRKQTNELATSRAASRRPLRRQR